MAKDKLKPAPKAEPTPDRTIEAHAMIRADGGWIRLEAEIPESVWSQYITHVSEPNVFGMLTTNMLQRMNAQKERG